MGRQYCTFVLEKHFFGVEVENVQEVIPFLDTTPVPLAAQSIQGLINLRGQIVLAVDLRNCLGLEARPADIIPFNVVLRTEDGPVSYLVDDIRDVLEVEEECFERPPDTVQGLAREWITGAYKLEHQLLLTLDPMRLKSLGGAATPV
jgi:purine-binding chemotaxis protein CheW